MILQPFGSEKLEKRYSFKTSVSPMLFNRFVVLKSVVIEPIEKINEKMECFENDFIGFPQCVEVKFVHKDIFSLFIYRRWR